MGTAVFLLVALAVSLQASVAGVFRNSRPQIVLNWAPYDAEARARLAVSLAENEQSEAARERAAMLARDAIRRTPIAPVALRALAVSSSADAQQSDKALALINMAERLSRRDRATQIWLIDHDLRAGRPESAMLHVDIVLRTAWSSRQALFPLLANALADKRVFDALADRLRKRPEWSLPLLGYLAEQNGNPAGMAQLAREFLDPRKPEDLKVIATHVEHLATTGEYGLAWAEYNHFGLAGASGQPAGALRNGTFEDAAGILPFAWWYAEEPDLWAVADRDPNGSGNVLRVAAISGRTGEVARQLVRLSPGRYQARAEFGDVPADLFDRPELSVTCATPEAGGSLFRLKPANAGAEGRAASAPFTIPPGCSFQWVSVAIAGDATEGETTPWIDNIELVRVGG